MSFFNIRQNKLEGVNKTGWIHVHTEVNAVQMLSLSMPTLLLKSLRLSKNSQNLDWNANAQCKFPSQM